MPPTDSASLDQTRQAMARVNDLFHREVFVNRNFAALDEIYTADARILPPGAALISGRAAIRDFWANLVESVNATAASLQSIDVMPAGDGMVEIGSARLTIAPSGQQTAELEVKYVVYWRQENQQWKWHVDIWNQSA